MDTFDAINQRRSTLTDLRGAPGVEEHVIDGTKVRMTTPAKTVADCFTFRNPIGTDVAIEALREFLRQSPQKTEALLRHARVDRVERVIRPYLESLA
jgi:predicted transcriptional regulator of viral defense system